METQTQWKNPIIQAANVLHWVTRPFADLAESAGARWREAQVLSMTDFQEGVRQAWLVVEEISAAAAQRYFGNAKNLFDHLMREDYFLVRIYSLAFQLEEAQKALDDKRWKDAIRISRFVYSRCRETEFKKRDEGWQAYQASLAERQARLDARRVKSDHDRAEIERRKRERSERDRQLTSKLKGSAAPRTSGPTNSKDKKGKKK